MMNTPFRSLTLKQKNTSVALLDMNDVFGEIPMFLDLTPKHHWGNITKNIERLDDVFLSSVLVIALIRQRINIDINLGWGDFHYSRPFFHLRPFALLLFFIYYYTAN